VSASIAETFEGRRTEKIERYTETSRGSNERERETKNISRRTQARTQRRRRRCGRGIIIILIRTKGNSRPTHGSEGPEERVLAEARNPHPIPNLS
jgi:hypothetical protein